MQVALAAVVPLLPEEAYHWNFSRHPDWSYYDHPPMLPWSIALGRMILGDSALGVRLVPLLFSFGTTWLLARMARRCYGSAAGPWAVLLYAVQPAAFFVGGWGFPDAPVLFFWALTMTWVWRALDSSSARWWLAAGVALGCGMLSKYTASFLVPSVLLYLLRSPRDRRWLATPWPYLAGVCSLVVFLPVIYWNWQHDWASFRFQFTARFQAADGVRLGSGLQATGEQWLFLVPLTLPLAIPAVRRLAVSAQPLEQFLFFSFAPTALFFGVLGWTPSFHLLWPLPAYQGLTVALAGALGQPADGVARCYRRHWGWLVGISAACVSLVAVHTVCVVPGVPPLRETYGWDEAAQECRSLQAGMPPGTFYLAIGRRPYPPASQLAFHLHAPDQVYAQNLLGLEALQYRFWTHPEELAGRDSVVAIEGGDATGQARKRLLHFFQHVEPAEELCLPTGTLALWSTPMAQFTFYRAYGYQPEKLAEAFLDQD